MAGLRDLVGVPGLLSLSRLPLAGAFAWTAGRVWWQPALVLALAGASDVLDGWYARRFGQTSTTGAVLDAVMDKLFVVTVVIALVVAAELTVPEAILLGTREAGVLGIACLLAIRSRQTLAKPHPHHALGKLTTALQYAAVLAAVARSSAVAVFALAAAGAGVLATATYWRHERVSDTGARRGRGTGRRRARGCRASPPTTS